MLYATCGMGFVALLVATRAFIAAGPADPPKGPQVQADENPHNFGKVAAGTVLKKTFHIRNAGPLRVVLNRRACVPCGDPKKSKPIILGAGETTKIELTLNTTGKTGRIKRVIRFTTSDPRKPGITFEAFATVVAEGE